MESSTRLGPSKICNVATGAHNVSKTCKQVGKQIQEIVKYCNEEYQCTGQNTGHIMSDKYGNQRPRQNLLV